MKSKLILLLIMSVGELMASPAFYHSLIPHPLQPVDDTPALSHYSSYRSPAAIEEQSGLNNDPELMPFLNHRIYYYDPKSKATCLGIEGENECLNP